MWNDTNHSTFAAKEQGAVLPIYSLNAGESLGPDSLKAGVLVTRSSKVPNHEILGTQHLIFYEKS